MTTMREDLNVMKDKHQLYADYHKWAALAHYLEQAAEAEGWDLDYKDRPPIVEGRLGERIGDNTAPHSMWPEYIVGPAVLAIFIAFVVVHAYWIPIKAWLDTH